MGLVGGLAPNFTADAIVNGGDSVNNFSLEQFIGNKYVILFFYPKDFTFVVLQSFMHFKINYMNLKKEIVN
jgi:peroxiredoxin (alkyl hydroperoxide reductase subunit C)